MGYEPVHPPKIRATWEGHKMPFRTPQFCLLLFYGGSGGSSHNLEQESEGTLAEFLSKVKGVHPVNYRVVCNGNPGDRNYREIKEYLQVLNHPAVDIYEEHCNGVQ